MADEFEYEPIFLEDPTLDKIVYYFLLVPSTFPTVIFFLLLAWIGRKFFTHNWNGIGQFGWIMAKAVSHSIKKTERN